MEAISDLSQTDRPIAEAIDSARDGNMQTLGKLLQLYRNYLSVLATTQLGRRLRRPMNTSDLVQETMLAAHRDFRDFRGGSEGELLAWLRQILSNCLSHAVPKNIHAKKRNILRCLFSVAKKMKRSVSATRSRSISAILEVQEFALASKLPTISRSCEANS
ncbi:RNA polymerase sigma factor RpoE [Aureliella helgolandensis]|uniref:RNA polymerase sigma factor RpoE n=1 Tax=Aureliella helgolandensis TaxID=2527968 RepID=A0A518GB43_9BACT|nr:RNA polymerase sigma factor RpoE [Aureliella helgolandensis]